MASLEDAVGLIEELPQVTIGERHGNRTWFVAAKAFAWERPFSKADLKRFGDDPVPQGAILALRTAGLEEKEAVLSAGHRGFFTIPHFDGYAAVLVELRRATRGPLRAVVEDAWLACAPEKLIQELAARRK